MNIAILIIISIVCLPMVIGTYYLVFIMIRDNEKDKRNEKKYEESIKVSYDALGKSLLENQNLK